MFLFIDTPRKENVQEDDDSVNRNIVGRKTRGVAQQKGEDIAKFIAGFYSTKAYTEDAVSDRQIDLIMETGIKAPSAINLQSRHFTVIKDLTLMKKMIPDIKKGNVLSVVSTHEKTQAGSNVDFDCRLATANIYLAALVLGLGSRIYTGPIANVNANNTPKVSCTQTRCRGRFRRGNFMHATFPSEPSLSLAVPSLS